MGVLIFFLTTLLVLSIVDLRIRLLFLLAPSRTAWREFDRLQYLGCRWIVRLARVYGGLKVVRESAPGVTIPGSALIVANHQSLVDIPMLIYAFPGRSLRFVAKRELKFGLPAFSVALRKGRHALIERRGGMSANERRLRRLAREAAREGWCPVVFPEGTRSAPRTSRLSTPPGCGGSSAPRSSRWSPWPCKADTVSPGLPGSSCTCPEPSTGFGCSPATRPHGTGKKPWPCSNGPGPKSRIR